MPYSRPSPTANLRRSALTSISTNSPLPVNVTKRGAAAKPAKSPAAARGAQTPNKSKPAVPTPTIERAALAGLLDAAIHQPENNNHHASVDHSRMLKLSRQPRLTAFAEKLNEAIESGALALASSDRGNDLLRDLGLQAKMRDTLDGISPCWLLPAMAVVLGRPCTTSSTELRQPFAGKFKGADDKSVHAGLRKSVLKRVVTLISLLDEAAMTAILPPSRPALFVQGGPHTTTEALLHQIQRNFLAKQGDVVITLRKLGAPLAYKQPAALTAPLPPPPMRGDNLASPQELIKGVVVLRVLMLARQRSASRSRTSSTCPQRPSGSASKTRRRLCTRRSAQACRGTSFQMQPSSPAATRLCGGRSYGRQRRPFCCRRSLRRAASAPSAYASASMRAAVLR